MRIKYIEMTSLPLTLWVDTMEGIHPAEWLGFLPSHLCFTYAFTLFFCYKKKGIEWGCNGNTRAVWKQRGKVGATKKTERRTVVQLNRVEFLDPLYKHDAISLCSLEFARGGLLCTGMTVLPQNFWVGHRRCGDAAIADTVESRHLFWLFTAAKPPAAEQIFCGIIVPLSHGQHLDGWRVWSRLSTVVVVVVVVVQCIRTDRRKLRVHYYLRSSSRPAAPHGGDSGGSVGGL